MPTPITVDSTVRTYDPKQVYVIIGGVPMSGLVSVSISQPEDSFEKSRGVDGTVDRTNKNVFDYEVTLTLKGTSLSNNILTEFHGKDLQNDSGTFPLLIENANQGVPILIAETAWIRKYPDTEFADTSSDREWMIDTGIAEYTPGGSLV